MNLRGQKNSVRMVGVWNSLPKIVVDAGSLTKNKNHPDDIWTTKAEQNMDQMQVNGVSVGKYNGWYENGGLNGMLLCYMTLALSCIQNLPLTFK